MESEQKHINGSISRPKDLDNLVRPLNVILLGDDKDLASVIDRDKYTIHIKPVEQDDLQCYVSF